MKSDVGKRPGRNAQCPCGSGRKFKHCHGKNYPYPPFENIASIAIDKERQRTVFVTKDILINQLHRDGPMIARSFDALAKKDLEEISAVIADAITLIYRHISPEDDDYMATCAALLSSAISTFMASVEVARHGYRRPYGAICRPVVETLSTILQIATEPDALSKFHDGKLQSTKSIAAAKKVLPPFGMLYGLLSNQFVHISKAHATFEATIKYTEKDQAFAFVISNLRVNAWLIYVVSELVFHSDVARPRYWKNLGSGMFAYDPSESERDWLSGFLGGLVTDDAIQSASEPPPA